LPLPLLIVEELLGLAAACFLLIMRSLKMQERNGA